jgi:hypothetical protein
MRKHHTLDVGDCPVNDDFDFISARSPDFVLGNRPPPPPPRVISEGVGESMFYDDGNIGPYPPYSELYTAGNIVDSSTLEWNLERTKCFFARMDLEEHPPGPGKAYSLPSVTIDPAGFVPGISRNSNTLVYANFVQTL